MTRADELNAISIHALCEEGDALQWLHSADPSNFYPRPLRGGRPKHCEEGALKYGISIHALCEEGDHKTLKGFPGMSDISIHALCEEGDHSSAFPASTPMIFLSTPSARRATSAMFTVFVKSQFLSTPSARRATIPRHIPPPHSPDFYPRPLRGGRRQMIVVVCPSPRISIHALCEEGDWFRKTG